MKRQAVYFLIFVLILLGGFLAYRYWGEKGKEGWVCENGQWVKQGNPALPVPTGGCEEGEKVLSETAKGEEEVFNQASFERNQQLAQKTAEDSPTYKFDGADLKYESYQQLTCQDCWEFTFSFSSRHAGYGDRKGEILAQVITPHAIRVNTQEEKIISVVTDRTFDELNKRFLK